MKKIQYIRYLLLSVSALVIHILHKETHAQCNVNCSNVSSAPGVYCSGTCTGDLYLCISKHVPGESYPGDTATDDYDLTCTECDDAPNCKWVHIRNMHCSICGVTPKIDFITVRIHKDSSGGTEFSFCNIYKQWGGTPWTQQFGIQKLIGTGLPGTLTPGTCYSYGSNTFVDVKFIQPTPIGTENYFIEQLNHFIFTICGAGRIEITVHYAFPHNGASCQYTYNDSDISFNRCPDPSRNCLTGW